MGKAYSSAAERAKAGVGPMPDDPQLLLTWVGDDPERARLAWKSVAGWSAPAGPHEQAQRVELLDAIRGRLPWFDLDEVRFHCYGNVTLLDLSELTRAASSVMESPDGAAALADFFEAALGRAEYRRFKDHTRAHGTSEDIIASIMQDLAEEFTARPTMRPSPSAPGPLNTIPTSKVISPSGQVTETPMTLDQFHAWLAQTQAPHSFAATPVPG